VLRAFRELRAVRAELRSTTATASPAALPRTRAA
jgi:hypothetical protein